MGETQVKLGLVVCEQKLLFFEVLCKARQTYIKKEAESLFKLFNNKICKAHKMVQKIFTLDNILNLLIVLELAALCYSHKGYSKYDISSFFCHPCFLLYCYAQLMDKQSSDVVSVLTKKVTLSSILLLSNKLALKIYRPRPVRRIFIRKLNGKTKPLSVMCSTDQIVQKAVLIFVEFAFEKQFLQCSHGFRRNKSCHTCLSSMDGTFAVCFRSKNILCKFLATNRF